MIDRGDTYLIPQSIASEHPNSGVFQAAGNSWNKGGIFDGFYIVVDFDIVEPANEHEPFAVSINDTCTVKSIQRLENGVRLLPNSYGSASLKRLRSMNATCSRWRSATGTP